MRMHRPSRATRLLGPMLAIVAATTPARAQLAGQRQPLEAFLRAAAAIGTPATQASLQWPVPITRGGTTDVSFSAAHAVVLRMDSAAPPTLQSVRYHERVRDTLTLTSRVTLLTMELTQHIGSRADRCMLPLGAPADLWVTQRVSRLWSRGLGGAATMLTWEVGNGPTYSITLTSSRSAGDDTGTWVACPP